MSLFTSLGLTPPKNGARPAVPQMAAPKAAPRPKAEVVEGELTAVSVRKESLGHFRWDGHRGELFGFTDASGALVQGGPRVGWRKMATCNLFGRRVIAANEDLNKLESAWRAGVAAVGKGTTDGVALAKRAKDSMEAISEHAKNDEKFAQVMNDYFRQIDALGPLADAIEKAHKKYSECTHKLKSTILDTKIQETNDEIADIKDQEAELEKERANTQKIFGQVLGLAGAIVGYAAAPAAAAAITLVSQGAGLAGNVLIDGVYDAKLGELEAQLKDAKVKLTGLKKSKYVEDIAAASDVLAQAAIECKTAAKGFTNALKELMRRGAPAVNVSSKSPKTAVISEVVARRAEQHKRLTSARTSAQQYLALLDGVSVGVGKLRDMYAWSGAWIKDIAVADSRLAPGSAWGNNAELIGASNAVQLGEWIARAPRVRNQCQAALKATEAGAANAALAPYDQAMKYVEDAMSQPARSNVPVKGR